MALTTPPGELGFVPDAEYPTVYGVLVDWPMDGDVVTILALRGGTASLYTTFAFQVIGGEAHAQVRKAAERCVTVASDYATSGEPVTDYPYPEGGQVYFYLLTYDGVRRCVGNETAIERGSDPTSELFAAAQDVMTELRLTVEAQDANAGE